MASGERDVAALPHPVLMAMVCADYAIREAETNKITLVGIFDRLLSTAFPLRWNRPSLVYVKLTDAQGSYGVRLELVRSDDGQAIGRLDAQVTMADRMASYDIVFHLNELVFERPGFYEFRLFANDRWVSGGVRLHVVQIENASQEHST